MTVGAFDAGFFDETAATERQAGGAAALAALAAEMRAGGVELLVVAGANPVYDAPAFVKTTARQARGTFAEAMARVPFVVSLNDRLDETGLLADVLAPASHPFECWGDAALPKGLVAVQQPVIQPLFDTRGLLDLVVEWAGAAGDPDALAAVRAAVASAAKAPDPKTAAPAPSPSVAWHYLRAAWAKRLAADPATPAFDAAWNEVLRAGSASAAHALGTTAPGASSPSARTIAPAALGLLDAPAASGGADLELQLYPHLALGDGRAGNNGWLHELPDPVTRITWAAPSRSLRAASTRCSWQAATSSRSMRATRRSSRRRTGTRGCTTIKWLFRSASAAPLAASSAPASAATPSRSGSSRTAGSSLRACP